MTDLDIDSSVDGGATDSHPSSMPDMNEDSSHLLLLVLQFLYHLSLPSSTKTFSLICIAGVMPTALSSIDDSSTIFFCLHLPRLQYDP